MNDYAAQSYKFFDCLWHWMDPFTMINDRNCRAVEVCILIEAGQTVDESATPRRVYAMRKCVLHTHDYYVRLDTVLSLKGG